MSLILASSSRTRALMLRNAGLNPEIIPSCVDENRTKAIFRCDGKSASALAMALAAEKAQAVAEQHPGRLILGADQVLEFNGETYDKPETMDEARAQMKMLRGNRHRLISAAVLMRDDSVLWKGEGSAALHMRDFSDGFMDRYLAGIGEAALWSVGSYQIEGHGAQLFRAIEGDYFSILGLPLLDVLSALWREGEIME